MDWAHHSAQEVVRGSLSTKFRLSKTLFFREPDCGKASGLTVERMLHLLDQDEDEEGPVTLRFDEVDRVILDYRARVPPFFETCGRESCSDFSVGYFET